jgi:putative hemolysin
MYLGAALVALGITGATVILGDVIPKQISFVATEIITAAALPFLTFLTLFCKPLAALSSWLAGLIRGFFRIDARSSEGMTEDELRIALMEGEKSGIVESKERTMVEGVFYLGDRPVGTFMTHRSEIIWLDVKAEPETLRDLAAKHQEQRYFPVVNGNLDEVAGVVSVQDILFALLDSPFPGLKAVMNPPLFVPETLSALKAFESFKKGDADFLLVMDEYGGFAGVLSVRDLIEEIVGQLSAPNHGRTGINKQDDGTYISDGSLNIDEAAEVLALDSLLAGHQEYHTLAGFILNLAGEIPKAGETFVYNGYQFKILDMDGNRINKVLIYPPEVKNFES